MYNPKRCRGVAQPGRVLAWGARGRRFDSCRPDHKIRMSPPAALLFYRGYNGLDVVLLCNTGSEQARNACAVKGAHEQREWELHSCRPDHENLLARTKKCGLKNFQCPGVAFANIEYFLISKKFL